ncbi:hypothetical protein PF011_g24460 [Phytophthora fragariae]|uniref:Uncharacterized protein n=1 Tax=Phytophthora fragariae TaxID=53985 RepID=A0A6A3HZU6_9STRA|nr:hypothetical protein PF011_g24460 [Phytophthora fragariae]
MSVRLGGRSEDGREADPYSRICGEERRHSRPSTLESVDTDGTDGTGAKRTKADSMAQRLASLVELVAQDLNGDPSLLTAATQGQAPEVYDPSG